MLYVVDFSYRLITAAVVALLASCVMEASQETPEGTNQQRPFFSGLVTKLGSDKLSVSRTILGKANEERTFRITGETRIVGKLKVKSRVTVEFAAGEEGDVAVAVSIMVRDKPDKPK